MAHFRHNILGTAHFHLNFHFHIHFYFHSRLHSQSQSHFDSNTNTFHFVDDDIQDHLGRPQARRFNNVGRLGDHIWPLARATDNMMKVAQVVELEADNQHNPVHCCLTADLEAVGHSSFGLEDNQLEVEAREVVAVADNTTGLGVGYASPSPFERHDGRLLCPTNSPCRHPCQCCNSISWRHHNPN